MSGNSGTATALTVATIDTVGLINVAVRFVGLRGGKNNQNLINLCRNSIFGFGWAVLQDHGKSLISENSAIAWLEHQRLKFRQ